jgi:hypothetical protein
MTITDGAVTGNTATQTGGGIHTLVSPDDPCIAGCHLEITNTLVTGNAAVNGNGGGIAASPGLDPNDEAGTVDADGLQLINNVAGSNGGGFYGSFGNGPGTDVDLVDTSIRNNAAQQDGGGFALTDGDAQIDHTDVIGNEAGVPTETANVPTETADGGGYYLDGSNVTMDGGGDITNNEALLGIGGGIWNRGVLSLRGHNIDSNRAGHGGGIYNGTAGSDGLTITGAAVSANTAEGTVTDGTDVDGPRTNGEGGGIWNDSLLLMESSSINGNTAFRNTTETAMGGEGGGIYNAGGVQNVTTDLSDSDACDETSADGVGVCLSEVDLISNTAQGQPDVEVGANNVGAGKGGGIWNDGSSSDVTAITRLDRATFEENEADLGGGVFSNNAVLYVTGSAFVGNFTENTTSTAGGGAYISGGPGSGDSSSTVTATTFQDNESGFGAGIYYGGGGTNSVDHSLFYSNDANDEGGAFWNDGDLFLENSTVSGNDAGSQGGGLYNEGGEVSSNAVTFNENRAEADDEDAGGNVHDESTRTVRFRMTILADGFPNNCNQDGSDYEDDGYNLADDATCDFGPQNETGSFTSNNAGLDDLRDNGGPTLTHALFRSSPALDAVDPSFCRPPSTDQRYEPRPADGGEEENACDIGAFEHQTEDAFPSTGGDHNGNGGTNNPSPNPSGSPSPQPSASNPAPGGNPAPPPRCAAAARKFGLNLVSGTNGDDELVGTNKGDVICARGGDDEVRGRGGNDIIWLGAGDDHAVGGKGADQIRGGPGHDVVEGSRGGDEIHLGHGRDFAEGNAGNDLLYGHEGNDGLKGGPGGDQLFGGPGIDSCSGGPGTNSKQGCEP